ncbi:hypothetical protein DFJ58DRAFT_818031 [Suillus subalutaceus]|uniref:uncharacterized protein n=1 Tax=Suillus subalutaceus TaxID=48586 RepID=UPI001B87BFFA|nr:uncharacterized protein DFJ58DRAFT_818031 [Suillus subalutaceus]KAG1836643.1 hypothetical protein DFJ58DRAFT_818031 [Suillus subalutaceus]
MHATISIEEKMQTSVSTLQNIMAVESTSKLYTILENLGAPRFTTSRCFIYDVKANGLKDLLITAQDKLIQFSRARRTRQTLLRP